MDSSQLKIGDSIIPDVLSVFSAQRLVMEFMFDRIVDEFSHLSSNQVDMCKALLMKLFVAISREVGKHLTSVSSVKRRANEVIKSYTHKVCRNLNYKWTLAEMARCSGYESTRLSILFHQNTGMSPLRWLTTERIRTACELLLNSDKCIVYIAIETGFGGRSQPHMAFLNIMGISHGAVSVNIDFASI